MMDDARADVYDELQCGICLELFQDPRSLPCLHTFCVECIQRTLNDKHSLKCPVCRAEHQLGEEGAKLLPVNSYARQELPRKRLRQQQENNAEKKCECCGEVECADVAWCSECGIICKSCLAIHKKVACLKNHEVVQTDDQESLLQPPTKKTKLVTRCPRHSGGELKYFCKACTEMVCPECLLSTHKDHVHCTAEEARSDIETRMGEFADLVVTKKDEFNDHLVKLDEVEKSTDGAKSTVNEVFDAIVASVEAQRTEALQKLSESVKKIWSQKELMEVSLAQLDSFTRSVYHTQKCTASSSYVAMAAQGIKLMERLKETHGDKDTLHYQVVVASEYGAEYPLVVPLDSVVEVGQPSLNFLPEPNHEFRFDGGDTQKVTFEVFLKVGELPVIFPTHNKIQLNCEMLLKDKPVTPEVVVQSSSWKIEAEGDVAWNSSKKLVVHCTLSGLVSVSEKITYSITCHPKFTSLFIIN